MFVEIIGWIGALSLLAAYFLAARGIYPTDTWQSLFLNIMGAIFLAVIAFVKGVMPSVALNVIWIGIGFNALWKLRSRQQGSGGLNVQVTRQDGTSAHGN